MNRLRNIFVIVMVVTGLMTQVMASEQNNISNYYRASNNPPVDIITEQKAIMIAQQRFNGRVLAINYSDNTYRVKILSNQGTVHIIQINATDGAVISAH